MKKITYVIPTIVSISAFALIQVVPSFAADNAGQKLQNATNKLETHVQNQELHMQNQASHSATKQSNELQNIIQRADTLIANRLASLNALLTRIQSDSRLTASEKSSLTTDIQMDITNLTALKSKIDADTNAATARADAKTVITNYYIYAVFEPKMRLLITLNNLQTTNGYMQALVPQLQNLINTLKSQGKDTTQLQPLLDDISSQVNTINTTLTNDIATVQNISTTTKRNPSDFTKVRQDISQLVRADFAKIKSDIEKMKPLFKQLGGTTQVTPTTSISGTPTTETTEMPSVSPAPTQ